MDGARLWGWVVCSTVFAVAAVTASAAENQSFGINWGTMMSHPLLPIKVAQMLKDSGIKKVKLFDADPWMVSPLAGTGIETILAIPNDQLEKMSSKFKNARQWVEENVTKHYHDGGVNIKYVAVGNEPFLKSYNNSFTNFTFPALKNIQKALNKAGFGDRIKVTTPLNADVYNSPASKPVPSAGSFRKDIEDLMVRMVRFLHANGSPFMVNIYPFLSLYESASFPIDFAFFDGGIKPLVDNGVEYTNVFDANYDTLVWSLKKAGVPDMKIIVGEVGWPTDGDKNANKEYAKRFYDGLLKKFAENKGTPMRPGPMDVYLFSLFDEDMKSVLPGNFERHWGLFTYDGKPKFPMGDGNGDKYLVGAKGVKYLPAQWCVLNEDQKENFKSIPVDVNYACSNADCTPLGYGSSCNGLSLTQNISYAFNIYFQTMDQDVRACNFDGLGKITTRNLSEGSCLFPVQLMNAGERLAAMKSTVLSMIALVLVGLLTA